jgi:hypothetical protein
MYYAYYKLAIFTFLHKYKEDYTFSDFFLASYVTTPYLLYNVKLDFFTKPVKKPR